MSVPSTGTYVCLQPISSRDFVLCVKVGRASDEYAKLISLNSKFFHRTQLEGVKSIINAILKAKFS